MWPFKRKIVYRLMKPVDDKSAGLKWVWLDGQWREVCDMCNGNCGQCGITSRVGNVPASFAAIIEHVVSGK